jgi:acyl carrier protein
MSMQNAEIRQGVVEVFSTVFHVPAEVVAAGVSPEGIEGWTSEKHVELVVALEERFGMMFEAEEVPDLISLEQMESIISGHLGAG